MYNPFSNVSFKNVSDLIPLVPYGYRGIEDKIISETIDKVSKQEEINMDTNFMKNMFGPIKGGLCRLSMYFKDYGLYVTPSIVITHTNEFDDGVLYNAAKRESS